MRVLIAIDKYKGSLTATQVAMAIQQALARCDTAWNCDLCPIADGGEGTVDAIVTALKGSWMAAPAHDALGRPIVAPYGIVQHAGISQAVMEMSTASGLAIVSDLPPNPTRASTYGTGEMLRHATAQGVGQILIGIGGSATNDGGLGMAIALGWRALDAAGTEITDLPAAAEEIASLQPPPNLNLPPIIVACDVTNPLLGPTGASAVYGPQKGVQDVPFFENRLRHIADLAEKHSAPELRDTLGAGAAGGLGFGLMAFASGTLASGFQIIADLTDLRARVAAADIVITGEGRLDSQTLHGKGPHGVALLAKELGKPVVAIAGGLEDVELLEAHFDLLLATKPAHMPLLEAIQAGTRLIEETVERNAARFMELAQNRR
ncbi:MAG: glycerate kinase [Verrucomicrobiaceae bacterium]|nr:glycerate kinase [Verrucomicrobiaceae bacterium]